MMFISIVITFLIYSRLFLLTKVIIKSKSQIVNNIFRLFDFLFFLYNVI